MQPPNVTSPQNAPALSHNTMQLLEHLEHGRNDEISAHFITVLEFFRKNNYTALNDDLKFFVNTFVRDFLFTLSLPKYVVSGQFARQFVLLNPVI
ncbi:MAG TPA: hypothetical protein VIW02_06965, partial [Gammaproteobacteria bacterium]